MVAAFCVTVAVYGTVNPHSVLATSATSRGAAATVAGAARVSTPAVRHAAPSAPIPFGPSAGRPFLTVAAGNTGAGMVALAVVSPLMAAALMLSIVRRWMPETRDERVSMAAVTCAEVDARFPPLRNDRVLRAIRGLPVDRIPVWVMRQAGRYLPEYVEFTKDKEFFSRCQDPEVACTLTLQPFARYDLDAGIIFSDILVIPQALGLDVSMVKGQGPVFGTPLRTKEQWYEVEGKLLERVGVTGVPEAEREAAVIAAAPRLVEALSYVYDAITLTRTRLEGRAPLIGFCGSPWTLFVYANEAKKTKTFTECSKWIYTEPEVVHRILRIHSHICAQYLIRQVKAGAQMLQVFDSHANVLPPKEWREFSLPYMTLVAEIVKRECPDIPMIALPKDAPYAVEPLVGTPYDMVSLDPSLDLGATHRKLAAAGKGVQGNLAPTVMYAPPAKVGQLTREYLDAAFGPGGSVPTRYIANLGSGMNPDMDPACLGAFVDAVHSYGQGM